MKRILLLRHAKSSWANPDQQDFDRPLNGRGQRAALLIGTFMAKNGIVPDIVLCSSARRTSDTLRALADALGRPMETRILDTLYLASPESILTHIRSLPEACDRVLVIGHNPGLEKLAIALADPHRSDQEALQRMAKKYPTAALACFQCDAEAWPQITLRECSLSSFTTPRGLETN